MEKKETNVMRGTLCIVVGGICWGFSGACGQYLFTNYGTNPAWLTAVRMICAGVLLAVYGMIKSRETMIAIWKNRKDIFILILFAVCGLMFCQYAYLAAISYSNAGTATVLQYLSPLFIMIYICVSSRRLPKKIEVISILLALSGTFILATHGNLQEMVLTRRGLIWGILSGIAAALYSLIPREIMRKYGSVAVTGYGMLIGGCILCLARRVWLIPVQLDYVGIVAICAIVLIGTVIAFTLYLQGINDIGAVKASMLASVEPLSAALFAIVWLGTDIMLIDAAGFACILLTVFLLAPKEKKSEIKSL